MFIEYTFILLKYCFPSCYCPCLFNNCDFFLYKSACEQHFTDQHVTQFSTPLKKIVIDVSVSKLLKDINSFITYNPIMELYLLDMLCTDFRNIAVHASASELKKKKNYSSVVHSFQGYISVKKNIFTFICYNKRAVF